ncbi:MAG: hypothetical protein DMG13_31730 [Acidobacteria bacterium]|nr:MAG: hypothetical protein DMG13_31730 [Acidobacteriota bacterium]
MARRSTRPWERRHALIDGLSIGSFSFSLAAVEIIITLAKTLASFVSAWQNLRQAVRFETVIAFIAPGFIAFKAVADI